ncbi:hypothetical protein HQ496_09690 [bacterium]|nr:hypothetical protein [bacterium]
MKASFRRWSAPFIIAFVVLFAGCDATSSSSDTVFLTHEFSTDTAGQSVRFTFSSTNMTVNRLTDVSCNCDINIYSFVEEQGFQASDIKSATLVSADIIMLFPISKKIDFLNQAILKFSANGISTTEVANISTFPAAREVAMNVLPNRDIATFLERSAFGAILQLDPATLGANESYDLSIILKVRLELEDSI